MRAAEKAVVLEKPPATTFLTGLLKILCRKHTRKFGSPHAGKSTGRMTLKHVTDFDGRKLSIKSQVPAANSCPSDERAWQLFCASNDGMHCVVNVPLGIPSASQLYVGTPRSVLPIRTLPHFLKSHAADLNTNALDKFTEPSSMTHLKYHVLRLQIETPASI